ncbi:CBS domain-containing protein [Sphaerisporangium dianthi]|uniref:CBS domain-containing protein n=1 Tax=Sphaerisporangium dianthi TaxID=1436120 RepID=A0ABV9CTG4_9ACTN
MTMKVRDVMGMVAITASLDAPFAELVETMRRFGVGAVTIVDADRRPVGVVMADDALLKEIHPGSTAGGLFEGRTRRAEHRKAAGTTAREIMTSPAITVTEGTPVRDAARLMHVHRIKQLPVINVMTGRVAGTVHQGDLLKVFTRPAAEIERDVRRAIAEADADPAPLSVLVEAGVVTLRGRVALRSQTERVTGAVEAVDGVVGVDAGLTFTTDDLASAPQVYL